MITRKRMDNIKDDANDDEPIAKKIKAALPSDETLTKFIQKIVNNSDATTLSWKHVCDMVNTKYPYAVEFKKYFIKTLVESLIVQKLISQVESDEEILLEKAKKEPIPTFLSHPPQQTKVKKEEDKTTLEFQNTSDESATEERKFTSKTIELTLIGDDQNKIKNYYDDMGYMYSVKRTTDSAFYMRCKNDKLYNCKASVIVRRNDPHKGKVQKNHNHIAEKKHLDRVKFNKTLEQICRQRPFYTPRKCFHEAKKHLRPVVDMNNIPSLKSFESLIYRCQKVDIPLLPKSIAELEEYITDSKYGQRYTHDLKGKLLFRGVWKGNTGNNVAFVSETVLEQVRKERRLKLLMDGTFKVLPCHLKFRQLYIINVIIKKRCYPLAFILMEKKDTVSYELILEEMKALIASSFTKVTCMSDYEAATRKAIRKVFPGVKIYGCYFHYVQAITKAFRRFRLVGKSGEFDEIMHKISALALLPQNYVSIGFELIASNVSVSKSTNFTRFADYWRKQWAPANISVYGLRNRTNNFAESLNKSINLLIGNRHPHIWRLIHNLRLVEGDKTDELIRAVASKIPEKSKKNGKMKSLNKKIKAATKVFKKHQNVTEFLEAVTFNENMQNHFKERIYIEGIDKNFSEFADEYDEDEVIPNDIREDSIFRLAHPRKSAMKNKKK